MKASVLPDPVPDVTTTFLCSAPAADRERRIAAAWWLRSENEPSASKRISPSMDAISVGSEALSQTSAIDSDPAYLSTGSISGSVEIRPSCSSN